MGGLEKKVEIFLGEFRIIVPGLGALLGFQLMVAFQPSFGELPPLARHANYAGVLCTLVALVLMVTPAGYHRFTQKVDYSRDFLAYAQGCISGGMLFLAVSLSLAVYVQGVRTFASTVLAVVPAGLLFALLAVLWWIVPWRKAHRLDPQAGEPLAGGGGH